jgi:hypothetical protein
MEQFDHLFALLPEHRLGVGKTHSQGVLLSQLPSNPYTSHQDLPVPTRKAIVSAAAAFAQWAMATEEVV